MTARKTKELFKGKYFTRYYHVYPNGRSMVEDVKIKFEDWLDALGLKSKFLSMGTKDRMKVFLMWKWQSEDYTANFTAEMTQRDDMELRISQEFLDSCDDYVKEFWQRKIYWEEQCNRIRSEWGLPLFKIACSKKTFASGEEVKVMSLDQISKELFSEEEKK